MAAWFSNFTKQAIQLADGLADTITAQAAAAQLELSKEHESIKKEARSQLRNKQQLSSARLPWEPEDETKSILSHEVMERILSLCGAEENFLISPKSEPFECIPFDFQEFVPVALRLLQIDANLARMHAKLSPKMNEEIFWRNFYVRVIYLRAIIGMDGPEAQSRFKHIPEDGLLFKYKLPPTPTQQPSTKIGLTPSPVYMEENTLDDSILDRSDISLALSDVKRRLVSEDMKPLTAPAIISKTNISEATNNFHPTSKLNNLSHIMSITESNTSTSSVSTSTNSPTISPTIKYSISSEATVTSKINTDALKQSQAALAAEVAAELGDDPLLEDLDDFGDLDINDDDFEDLNYILEEDDAELEAQIARELAEEL